MKSVAIAALFVAAATASHHRGHARMHAAKDKRQPSYVTEVEWVTETEYVTELIDATTTVWVQDGQTKSMAEETASVTTESTHSASAAATSSAPDHFYEPPKAALGQHAKDTTTSVPTQAAAPPPPPPAPEPVTTSKAAAPPPPPPAPSTTSSSVVAAPPPPPAPVAAAPSSASAASGGSYDSGSSGGGSSGSFTGDMTYYAVGLGSCGETSSEPEHVVALSLDTFMSTAGKAEYCGKTITIEANGKSVQATVLDSCPGCAGHSIDVSEAVFTALFGDLTGGRETVSWSFN